MQAFLAQFVRESSKKIETRLDEIADTIGNKPAQLNHELDAPHLWGAISELVTKGERDKIDQHKLVNENLLESRAETVNQIDDLRSELELSFDQANKLSSQRVLDLRKTVTIIARAT